MSAVLHTADESNWPSSKITHSVISVTPEMAKRWMDNNNSHNRDISEFRVADYADDMEAGRWTFNGETIQFDRTGILLNGQHRLMAIIATGIAQTFLIVHGLDPAAQLTMDQGTRRTPAEQLAVAGIITDKTIPAAIRTYIRWQKGFLFGDQVDRKRKHKLTTSEIVQWAIDNPDLIALLRDLSEAGVRRSPCSSSMALAVALRFSLIDERDCLFFFGKLVTGADLPAKSPILGLRARLLNAQEARTNLTERDLIGFFTIAWNAYRDHRDLGKIQRPRGASWSASNFPVPR